MNSKVKLLLAFMLLVSVVVINAGLASAQSNVITVVHELGTAKVVKNPKTVLVFDFATLDTLDNMGVEITGLPKSNIPGYLSKYNDKKYVDVGTLFEPNFEKVYELRPDVIFISGRTAEQYDELSRIAPTVYLAIDQTDYLGSFQKNLEILGQIFGKEDYVAQQLSEIKQGFNDVREKVIASGKNALILMANDGSLSAYGPGSRFGVVHKEFGFPAADANIQVVNHGQNVSFEYIAKVNPDYLLVIDRAATVGGSVSAEQTLNNDLVKMTDAYKNNNIIYLTSQVWYVASGGLTGTKTMIEDIAKAFR